MHASVESGHGAELAVSRELPAHSENILKKHASLQRNPRNYAARENTTSALLYCVKLTKVSVTVSALTARSCVQIDRDATRQDIRTSGGANLRLMKHESAGYAQATAINSYITRDRICVYVPIL